MWLCTFALAAEPEVGPLLGGEYRLIGSLPGEMTVDTDGTRIGQAFVLDQRLRLGLGWQAKTWHAATEWDFLTGQVVGDTWDILGMEDDRNRDGLTSFTLDGIRPRRLSVGTDAGAVRLEFGLQTSQWGLGLVANDGVKDPLFGRSDFGDRVIRFRAATRAAPNVLITGAFDVVAADDLADLARDQLALQGVGAVLFGGPATGQGGVYVVYRHQVEDAFADDGDRRETDAVVLDLYGNVPLVKGNWTVQALGEGAGILGTTERSLSYTAREGLGVASLGAAGRLELSAPKDVFQNHLRLGYASGDGAPDDGVTNAFTFDRDFDVGMVLFDEVQGAVDAAAYAQLTDPEYSGQPPDGADSLVSEGALRGAAYVQEAITVKPLPWAKARVGVMAAWATAPIAQPFTSFRAGGVPTNHLGEATTGRYLGTELDWALIVGDDAPPGGRLLLRPKLRPSLVVQGGHAFLSEDMGGETVHVLMAAGRLRL
jgi:hypothetical protein